MHSKVVTLCSAVCWMARCIPEPCAAPSGSCRTLGFEYVLETHPKFLIKGVVSKRTLIIDACIFNVFFC